MIIDFKEIPAANTGSGHQDRFELFSRDFLEGLGFQIIDEPNRGKDRQKDLIVVETRKGIAGDTNIRWLVSCKHYAHSGKSVPVTDEQNISDRLQQHDCQGFIGVYSSLPGTSLGDMLNGLRAKKIEIKIYDYARIESELMTKNRLNNVFSQYFPLSYQNYKADSQNITQAHTGSPIEESVFQAAKDAGIIIEIIKIRDLFFNADWAERKVILDELVKFSRHSSYRISKSVYDFLEDVSHHTRTGMPRDIALSIHSLTIDFAPYFDCTEEQEIVLLEQATEIGFNIAYDALIKLNNIAVASWALLTLKYVYINADKRLPNVLDKVLHAFSELQSRLGQPEEDEFANARELVQCYKLELASRPLRIPDSLPRHIFELTNRKD